MEAKKQSELIEKYWRGETSAVEEKVLLSGSLNGLEGEEQAHFIQLKKFAQLSMDEDFEASFMAKIESQKEGKIRPLIPVIFWKVAAVVLIGFSAYWLYQPMTELEEPQPQLATLEEDPEKAFEVTKQALLLISTKLNKATTVDLPLEKFEETRAKIQE